MGKHLTTNQVLSVSRDKRSAARISDETGIPIRKIRQIRRGRTFNPITSKEDRPSTKRFTGASKEDGACIDNPLPESSDNFDMLGSNSYIEFNLTGDSKFKGLLSPDEEQKLKARFACPETASMTQQELHKATKLVTKAILKIRIPKN